MTHLDTSFLIRALVRNSFADKQLREWLGREVPLGVSTIVWAEFLCSPVEAHEVELATRVVPEQVPFDAQDAVLSAHLFNPGGGRRRGSLADSMIAATAIRRGASLATANPADFRKLESAGLKIVAE
jgi:Predicted nucleic acid-binding protein, contains PIN domain